MHEVVKEGYGGGGGLQRGYHSMGDFGGGIFGLSWICREELSLGVGRFSTGALVCWRFWA